MFGYFQISTETTRNGNKRDHLLTVIYKTETLRYMMKIRTSFPVFRKDVDEEVTEIELLGSIKPPRIRLEGVVISMKFTYSDIHNTQSTVPTKVPLDLDYT